jgi:GNAT superfamily N-acetyltransferase
LQFKVRGGVSLKVEIINENKKDFLDLLFLADEQEDMIDKYLDRGVLFALYDDDLKSVCVVTDEGNGAFEIQNLATYPQFQKMGYGRYLINYVCDYYKNQGKIMLVGTGDIPVSVRFYENSGFAYSHRIENYILEHYDKPIFEDGVQLIDKVYLKRRL